MNKDRVIFHCDLNAFYASVELLEHPELLDQPVAVCGDPKSRRGIILAKNEPAKKMGVKTAETIWQAQRKCPNLVLLPAHHETYFHYSKLVNEIYGRYTDLVEPFGIDESWLDVTGSLHLFGGDGVKLADEIRAVVKRELGLTISIGVSFNKVFSKLGSDYKKPDATTLISRGNYQTIVWPLPVTELLFVGRTTAQLLKRYGIETIGQLAAISEEKLSSLLGKHGAQLHRYATGEEHSPVRAAGEREAPKSVGNGTTFRRNLVGEREAYVGASLLAERVGERLRRYGFKGTVIQVTVRDPEFRDKNRQRKLERATNVSREILSMAMELLGEIWDYRNPIRALTITVGGLLPSDEAGEQLNLFAQAAAVQHQRQEKIEQTMDALRHKYGKRVVSFATAMSPEAKAIKGEEKEER